MADETPELSWDGLEADYQTMNRRQSEEKSIMRERHFAEISNWFNNLAAIKQKLQTGGTTGDRTIDFALLHAEEVRGDASKSYSNILGTRYRLGDLINRAAHEVGGFCWFELLDIANGSVDITSAVIPPSGLSVDPVRATLNLACEKYVRLDEHASLREIVHGPLELPRPYVLDCVVHGRAFYAHNNWNPGRTGQRTGYYLGSEFGDNGVQDCVFNRAWFHSHCNCDVTLLASVVLAKALDRDPETIEPIRHRVGRVKEAGTGVLAELATEKTRLAGKGRDFATHLAAVEKAMANYTTLTVELEVAPCRSGPIDNDQPTSNSI